MPDLDSSNGPEAYKALPDTQKALDLDESPFLLSRLLWENG